MNYALGQELQSGGTRSRDSENKAFWDKLYQVFETTAQRIEEQAEEMGFDLDEEDFDELLDQEEAVHEAAKSQTFSRLAMKYIDVADAWFKLNECLFADRGGELEFLTQTDKPADGSSDDMSAVRDCLEVIRWYQRQIYVKLCRAAGGTIRARTQDIECFQEDADGSAKVAIIGIERSIAAWATVLSRFPDHEDPILAMAMLKRLLRQVEAAFPNARAFLRPGFDTPMPNE
jgi:hypothetical protein